MWPGRYDDYDSEGVGSLRPNRIWACYSSFDATTIAATFVIANGEEQGPILIKNESCLSRNILSNQQELFLKSLT